VVTLDGFALAVSPQPLRMVGRTALVYTAMGGIFASVEDTMSSLRNGREDIWNGAVAGCAAGMVFGVNCTLRGGTALAVRSGGWRAMVRGQRWGRWGGMARGGGESGRL